MKLPLCFIMLGITTTAVEASALEGCFTPETFSFSLANTVDGAVLSYKHSTFPSTRTVTFEGYNVSSSAVCEESYQRCSLFFGRAEDPSEEEPSSENRILTLLLPLGEAVGLVTFEPEGATEPFSAREHRAFDFTRFGLGCEFTNFYIMESLSLPVARFFAVCESATDLYQVRLPLDVKNLTATGDSQLNHPQGFCQVDNPSRMIYFDGDVSALVFVDDELVLFFRGIGRCQTHLSGQQVCSDPERFVNVVITDDSDEGMQALYCPNRTYLIDIASERESPSFSRAEDGYPMFCSQDVYCSFMDNQLTLRYVSNRTSLLPPVDFPYAGAIIQGDCVIVDDQYITVIQLSSGLVVLSSLNRMTNTELGTSLTLPRVFRNSVQLSNSTHTQVYHLLVRDFTDSLEGGSLLGLVVPTNNAPPTCPPSTTESTEFTSTIEPTNGTAKPSINLVAAIVAPVVIIFLIAILVVAVVVGIRWRRNKYSGGQMQHIVQFDGDDGISSTDKSPSPGSSSSTPQTGNGNPSSNGSAPSCPSGASNTITSVTTINLEGNPPPASSGDASNAVTSDATNPVQVMPRLDLAVPLPETTAPSGTTVTAPSSHNTGANPTQELDIVVSLSELTPPSVPSEMLVPSPQINYLNTCSPRDAAALANSSPAGVGPVQPSLPPANTAESSEWVTQVAVYDQARPYTHNGEMPITMQPQTEANNNRQDNNRRPDNNNRRENNNERDRRRHLDDDHPDH